MDNTAASMAIRIDAEVSGAITGLKKVNKQIDALVPGGQAVSNVLQRIQFGFLQIIQGAARNTFVGITSSMKNMVTSGVKVAETLESAAVGFETVLSPGQNVNALLLDIQENAVKTPFDTDALTLSTQKLALITKNGLQAENTVLDLGKALAAAGRGTAELNRMATNLQQVGTNALITERDIREFGNAGIDITDIVLRFSDAFKESNNEMTKAAAKDWLKSIGNPYEVLTDALHKAGESVDGFAGIYEKGATTIKQANENMSDAIGIFSYRVLEQANVLGKVKNVFSELQQDLFLDKEFTANTIAAIRHIVEMINELDIIRPIIDGIKRAVSAFATGQFDNVIVFFRELFNAIKQFSGIQVIINAFRVLLDLFSDNHTADEVGRVANQIGTLIRYFLELKFVLSITNYLANFAGTIVKVGMALTDAIPSIFNFVSGLRNLSAGSLKFIAIAALIVGAIVIFKNFGSQIGELFNKIGEFFGGIGSAIGNVVNEFLSIGHNMMVGLWNGIVEGAKAVIEQVKNIARAIINTFKSMFGIHSPSTLMRDEIGRYIDEGIAQGITQYYGSVADATEEVLSKLVELQAEYVKELGDFGALDLVQQVKVYKDFASLYAKGTKARYEMDQKVHDAETSIIKEMISLIDDYNKAWDKAYQKAKDYYDMFEYTQATLTRSTKSVIEGLTRQNNNLTKYYNNIAKMSQMGFDSDFMTYIYEQGLDAAAEVSGLADATAEEIEEINNLWATRGKVAADIATLNTQELKEDTLEELDYLQSGLETKVLDYYDTGTYLDYNFARGIYDMMPTIQDAVETVKATTKGAGDSAKEMADVVGDALAGVDPEPLNENLKKLDIAAFDTVDAFSFLKNMLAGIPWQVWAVAVGILAYKVWDMFQNVQRDVPKAVGGIREGVGTLIQTLNTGIDNLIIKLDEMVGAITEKIGKVSNATYNSAREVSNYESVYRQAMQGVLSVTDSATSDVIDTIDFAKSQGIITTKDATMMIGDIMRNGLEDINGDTRASLDKIENELGMTISTSTHIVEDGLQTIDYNARDTYDQILYDISHDVTSTTSDIIGTVSAGTKQIGKDAGHNIVDELADTMNTVQRTVDKALDGVEISFDNTGKEVGKVVHQISTEAESVNEGIWKSYEKATRKTIDIADVAEAEIVESYDNMARGADSATSRISSRFSRLTSKLRGRVSGLSSTIGGLASVIAGVNPQLAAGLEGVNGTLQKGLETIDRTGIDKITDMTQRLGNTVSKGTGSVGVGVKKEVSKIETDTLKQTDGIQSKLGNKIVSIAQDIGQTISGVATAIVRTITDFLGNVVDAIMGVISKITGGIGKAIQSLLQPLSDPELLIGAGVLVAISASILILAHACQVLAGVDWESVGKLAVLTAIVVGIAGVMALLGDVAKYVLLGALALAAAGAAFGVATAAIGTGVLVLAATLKTASELGQQIMSDGLLAIMGAVALVSSLLTLMMPLVALGAVAGAFATILSVELLVSAVSLNLVSQAGSAIDLAGIQNMMLAIMGVASMFTLMLPFTIIGAIAGVFASVLSVEMLVIAAGLAGASQLGKNIDMGGIQKVGLAIIAVSVGLAANIIAAILGAVSGAFSVALSVEFLAIAAALWGASVMGKNIDLDGIAKTGLAITAIAAVMTASIVASILGAISGAFAAVLSVEFLAIAAALWGASVMGANINLEGIEKTQIAISYIAVMMTAQTAASIIGAFSGAFASMLSVEFMVIAVALARASVAAGDIEPDNLKHIGKCISILNQIDFGDFWQNWGNASLSAQVREVAQNVDAIITYLMDAVNKVAEMQKVTEQQVLQYMLHIGLILQILSTYNFGEKDAVNEKREVSEKLSAMTENVDKIIGTVHEIVTKLADLSSKVGRGQAEKYVTQAKEIVSQLSDFELSDEGGGWFSQSKLDKTKDAANKIAEVSKSVSDIMTQVKSIVDILAEFSKNGINEDTVHNYIESTKKIIDQFAEIKPSQEVEDTVKDNVSKIAEVSSSVDTILSSTKGIVNSLKELEDKGVTPETAKAYVEKANDIVEEFSNLALPEAVEGAYESLATNAGHLSTATTDVNTILKNATEMVDLVQKYEEAIKDKNVDEMVQNINEMIAQITGGTAYAHGGNTWHQGIKLPDDRIFNDSDVTTHESIKNVLTHIKEIAETINNVPDTADKIGGVEAIVTFIKESLAKIPETVKTYADDMSGIGESFAKKFQEGWESAYPNFEEAGRGAQDALWTAIEGKMNDEYLQGEALAKQVVDGINNKQSDMKTAGENLQGQFWAGIQNKFNDEYLQGQALSSQVVDGVWSKQGDWWWTGDNIVAGVAGGINRNMWQINEAAGNISGTAIETLRKLLRISSPSKVMSEMGGYVSEGFADGIIDNLDAVEEAGEALAEAVMDSYNDTIQPINLTAFEARNAANGTSGSTIGGNRTTSVVQNNNIYNNMDTAKALSDIAWAVSRQ